jgi:hypothetical protein
LKIFTLQGRYMTLERKAPTTAIDGDTAHPTTGTQPNSGNPRRAIAADAKAIAVLLRI